MRGRFEKRILIKKIENFTFPQLDLLGGLAKKSSIFFLRKKKTTREEEEKIKNGEEELKTKAEKLWPCKSNGDDDDFQTK